MSMLSRTRCVPLLLMAGLLAVAVIAAGCSGEAGAEGERGPAGADGSAGAAGPAGPVGPPGAPPEAASLSCTECHTDTTLITSKQLQWEQSGHGTGTAYVRGTRASCAGCHASEGFTTRIVDGLDPDEVQDGIPNPSPQDCRTCHDIHTSYTEADWALTTTAPVTLFVSGATFDAGEGNLCANCHQPRRAFPEAVAGEIDVNSTHWGPHLGVESAMLLGIGGTEDGSASVHYQVEDGCVTCHMGSNDNHTWEPAAANCQGCHQGLDTLDRNGVQTDIQALYAEVEEALKAKGLLDEEGHPVVGVYPEAQAAALWDWIFVEDDASWGVHNPFYTETLLEGALAALQ